MTNVPKPVVLVLENDEIILRSTGRILRAEGYDAYEALSPQEARAIVDGIKKPIGLLLCDLDLDGLHGREASIMLQAHRPEMRVLFMSGSDSAHFRWQLEKEHVHFLRKPFDRKRLVELVGRVLEGWKAPG